MSMIVFATCPVSSGPTNGRRQDGPNTFSFLRRFFSLQRHRAHRSADPPCFHPHFVWSLCSVPVGVLDLRNGCCYLERGIFVVSTHLARPVYAVTRTRRSWRKHTVFDLLGRCR